MLYFDHCATTPPYEEVVDTVSEVMKRYYGNPSSLHRLGVEAEQLLSKAREVIAASLKLNRQQLIFTSGGTESNNLAIKGVAYQYKQRGTHLITTMVEHPSVFECFKQLEAEGFRVTYLPVNEAGVISLDELERAICDETILVSIMHVNNEVGSIQPIEQVGKLLRNYPRIIFHVDAVQSIGKLTVKPEQWGIDTITVSAHKLRGPKGAGLLVCREGLQLYPLIVGGGQEKGLRSGTENVPLIVAMAKAIRMSLQSQQTDVKRLYPLKKSLIQYIEHHPKLLLNSSPNDEQSAPHIVNFSFPEMKAEVVVHALEAKGVYISSRSACSSADERPSRVLLAMGYDERRSVSGLRVSLSAMHTEEDIRTLCRQIDQVIAQLGGVYT